MQPPPPDPLVFVVMGVSGCGKSSVGTALALALGAPFLEGDELHPPENIAKMRSGIPLTDEDRWPWLYRIRERIVKALDFGDQRLVVSCSALKPAYRNLLRWGAPDPFPVGPRPHPTPTPRVDCSSASSTGGSASASSADNAAAAAVPSPSASSLPRVAFILLQPGEDELRRRLAARAAAGGHFMPPALLGSQLAALDYQPGEMWAIVEPPGWRAQRRHQRGAQGEWDGKAEAEAAAEAEASEGALADGPSQPQQPVFPAVEEIAAELAARLHRP
ncbi:hypothetical protein HXX76_015629 [Chlamydomonas incerta]|uniref:Gluconokinase n=1 Tax=Chlamydomonas incerta TaxID=51695 RepID=A0A835SGG8_CHLIN|nr:hypothetical protein HXX76_015629 [Chlamydomonas incerta]|eukprot:KAG2422958.1 hypothetical protein HXX76_015629 [Chlamydomonas incerta]